MSLPKTFFESTRDILRVALIAGAPVVLCLILLYSLEQVSHLYTRVELAESALEQIQQEQVVQRQSIEQSREETEAVELRLDQMDSSDLRQDLNLFLLNYGTTHLERYIRAAHACFLVHDFAEAAEDNCTEIGDPYYCRMWQVYEDMCMNIDEEGNWVLPPDPDVYNQLMLLYFGSEQE